MQDLTKQQRTFIANLQKRIGKTIFNHKLISEGDRVLVGLSGGKDSFVLLDALSSRRNAIPFRYELAAAHISTSHNIYEADIDFMKNICENYEIKFFHRKITIDFNRDPKLSACFVCSWNRRTELFKMTNQLGFNKLALGHHMNDAAETLLLNMAFNAEISAMPHKVNMFDGKFEIIRPLLETLERDIIKYADLKDFNKQVQTCKYESKSRRSTIKNIIKELENVNKDVVRNIFRSMNKILPEYLPEKNETTRRKNR